MDDLGRETKSIGDFGDIGIWRKALRLLNHHAAQEIKNAVSKGASINWLAELVRDQGFAHGLPVGNRAYPERQWLAKNLLDNAIRILISRFKKAGHADVFGRPSPLDILFCWLQLGKPTEVRGFVRRACVTDDGFLTALNAMRSWSSSSADGVRHPLRADVLENFMDSKKAKDRLNRIRDRVDSIELRSRATELIGEWSENAR